jgi:predicted DNA-binding transcriptional regulator AlpA
MTIDFESLKERLKEMFSNRYKSEVDQYIESKNPKSAAEVEHWLQQYTYQNRHHGFGA